MLSLLFAFSLAAAWGFVLAHGPAALAVAAVVVSSIVTAGTEHPDVVPTNILHVLQFALQLLSVLTPKGSAAVLKLPLTIVPAPLAFAPPFGNVSLPKGFTRMPPPGVVSATPPPKGHASLFTLCLLAFLASSLAACTMFKSSFAADEKACVSAGVHDVEAQVAATLLNGGATYEQDLINLASAVGKDTVICAIQVAIADFTGQHAAEPALPAGTNTLVLQTPDAHTQAIARGKATLAYLHSTATLVKALPSAQGG